MFLLRTAFWLSLVILLLPADKETGDQAPRVSAFQAISAAQAAISDLSQFCERNPDVCVTGGSAFHVFADKVRYGAKMIGGYFGDAKDGVEKGTLKPEDASPEWKVPAKVSAKNDDAV